MEQRRNPIKIILVCLIAVVLIAGGIILGTKVKSDKGEPEVITKTTLMKIINVSELSTSTSIYNGIAKVMNEKKNEKVDYYVSYEAKVSAGIDFDKVEMNVDNDSKKIEITLPVPYITNIDVDVASMDFIFIDKRANKSTVTETALKACEQDVEAESKDQTAILELAQQNAVNVVTALVKPFVEQLDEEYTLTIDVENIKEESAK